MSTDDPEAVRPVLAALFGAGGSFSGSFSDKDTGEFHVRAEMKGASARVLNRSVLSALRRASRRTRLRAEWTSGRTTESFFDYVLKRTNTTT